MNSDTPIRAPALMLQGTGSDVGKSLLAAGLIRAFRNRGLLVRPFKPQNMSNNAAVTADGGEIGRAQALQAKAARLPLSLHMNPVLLKPQTDVGAQVVVQGKVIGNCKAADYHDLKPQLMPKVLESFAIIGDGADLVMVEGAGSPAEVNLRDGDIANMGFAEAADVPVVLVADIDRGGVIASVVGTHVLLEENERARLRGIIVNKFRGDPALFESGIDVIRDRTGLQTFGVVPWFAGAAALPKEDAMALDNRDDDDREPGDIIFAVPRFQRIANFDDLDPLAAEPGVAVVIVEPGEAIPGDADVVLLPGSKATLSDLAQVRDQGWDTDILAHRRRGGIIVGLCGGYQILGTSIADPGGIEGELGEAPGLGMLDVQTILGGDKTLTEVEAIDAIVGADVRGYEMHIGRTEGADTSRPWMLMNLTRPEGAVSRDGKVLGCYLHGLFAADDFRRQFLKSIREGRFEETAYEARVETALDDLAEHLERHLDLDALLAVARANTPAAS